MSTRAKEVFLFFSILIGLVIACLGLESRLKEGFDQRVILGAGCD
jgi:hypothetical protein